VDEFSIKGSEYTDAASAWQEVSMNNEDILMKIFF